MKLLVCGSREINASIKTLSDVIAKSGFKPSEIISGGAKGADTLAQEYAETHNLPFRLFKPDWEKHGKRAGIFAECRMVKACDAVVALWDGKSKGTEFTLDYANREGKPILLTIL